MNELKEELRSLEEKSLRRSLKVVSLAEGSRLVINNQSLINFSSNNYLGLARHPQVIEAVKQVLDHWGAGATSSRLISGTTVIHEDLENALAAYVGKESALVFPTGYQANIGVISTLVGPGDAIVMDRLCHASLVDAAKLSGARFFVYKHADAFDAKRVLERASSYRRRILVTESLFSMDGDFAPVKELAQVAQEHDATFVIDEAHALGVWGEGGRGLTAGESVNRSTGQPERRSSFNIVVGTLSKSLGSQGGFVAGSREIIEMMINKARSFIFTTSLSPANVAAAQAALSICQEDKSLQIRTQNRSQQLREGIQALGFNIFDSQSQIVPILLGETETALSCANHLLEAGIFAPAIRPPTVHSGECRIRFSVTADHKKEDIEALLSSLKEWKTNTNE